MKQKIDLKFFSFFRLAGKTGAAVVVAIVLTAGLLFCNSSVKGDTQNNAKPQENASEYRIWKDKSERFSVEAVLVEQDSQRVKLKKKDGRTLSLPVSRLSQKDQEYLKEQLDNPFAMAEKEEASKADSSTASQNNSSATQKTAPKQESPASKATFDPARLYEIEELKQSFPTGDRSNEKTLVSGGNSIQWKYKPEPVAAANASEQRVNVPLFGFPEFAHEFSLLEQKLFFPSGQATAAYLSFKTGVLDQAHFYLQSVDTQNGATKLYEFPFHAICSGVSPDGTRVLAIHQYKPARGGFDTKKLLSVLEIGEKELKPELEFLPYLSAQTKAKSGFTFSTGLEGTFEKACWIANDLVLTTDQQQQELVLWNLSDCRSLWSLRARFDTVSVSGDGKALLAATAGGICLYDVRSGEQLGVLQGEAGKVRATSFSPDGTRAAVLTGTTLAVYELNSGGLFAEIPRTAGLVEQPIWTDNDNILVGGILYNLEKKLPLCRYTNILPIGSTVAFHRGVVWMVIGMGNKAQLVGNVLPQAELHNKLAELDPKTMFVLSPGASVKMEFELHDLMDEAKVRTLLTERLESKKFTISEASPLTVKVVVMDTGKEVEVGYEQANSRAGMIPPPLMAGRTRELGTVKLKVFAQIIIILSEGKEVWKYGVVTTGPRMVQYDPNKKVEDSIRESNHPEETFVRIAPIPDYIPKSGKSQGALYNAKITPEGIK